MVFHKGEIAKMRTGEGKTLVAVLSAFFKCIEWEGSSCCNCQMIIWLGGVVSGLVRFLIVLNSELWNVQSLEDLVIRGFNYCVIDEVD
ncbi:hypothetical protein Fmac_003758 [Flemingia macrophylla]|uniref:SecA DEAD-like N-terminal domain-containing protein n=1 Tax=Flemingia macrophylla TaxID=520843 RepID=A0ABD1N369_9FABA